jgi:hypothetical protein
MKIKIPNFRKFYQARSEPEFDQTECSEKLQYLLKLIKKKK